MVQWTYGPAVSEINYIAEMECPLRRANIKLGDSGFLCELALDGDTKKQKLRRCCFIT